MTIKFKKSSVLFLLFFAAIMSVQAQEMSVKSFKYLEKDLTARTKRRNDINDNPAAVIRVGIALQGVVFEGNVLGEPVYNTGEYLVYMSAGSRKLTVHHPNFLPLEVTFADYEINQLEGQSTYRLTILTNTPNPPAPQETGNYFVLNVNHSGDGTLVSFTVKGVTFKMVKVAGGTFTMGATAEQEFAYDDERPAHQVTLTDDYYIGQTQVTQALWTAVMGSNPSNFTGDNLPVEKVSWDDCQSFIEKLNSLLSNELDGMRFALPTEAQWEFAARGGKQSKGYKYAGSNNIDDVAWYGDARGYTHPVAQKQPNELGLYDMSGNVYEWCQDWFGGYSSNAQTNPQGPKDGEKRVIRGGSWHIYAERCRVSNRYDSASGHRYDSIGFRLCLIR